MGDQRRRLEGGWGSQDDAESIAAIERAPALGIDWIETAAVYGLGHSEEVVRRALIANSPKRDSIRSEVEASLSRLGVDAIDLYQIHWPNLDADIEEVGRRSRIKGEGLVRHIGVSNFDAGQLRRAQTIAPVETLHPPYALVDRGVEEEIVPFAERERIGVRRGMELSSRVGG